MQYTDKVIDVPVVPVQFPSADVEKTAELPHCSRRALDKVVDMPVCAMTSARGAVPQGCGRRCVHAGQGFPPPSGRGRGGGDAGSLLPGVLPPN